MEREIPHSPLGELVGKKVWLDKGAPHEKTGVLLSVKPDHLVLKTENEGVIYVQSSHIRRVIQDEQQTESSDSENTQYIDGQDFKDLLKSMKNRMIYVDQGGKEKLQGVLTGVYDDFLYLVRKNEVSAVFTFHIRYVQFPLPGRTEENKEGSANDGDKAKVKISNAAAANLGNMTWMKLRQPKRGNVISKLQKKLSAPWMSEKVIPIKNGFVS